MRLPRPLTLAIVGGSHGCLALSVVLFGYDGQPTGSAFAGSVRSEVSLEALTDELTRTTGDAVRPIGLGLWLRGAGR